jgi:hypothetical protein
MYNFEELLAADHEVELLDNSVVKTLEAISNLDDRIQKSDELFDKAYILFLRKHAPPDVTTTQSTGVVQYRFTALYHFLYPDSKKQRH